MLLDVDVDAPLAELIPALLSLVGEQVHPSFAARVQVFVDGAPADVGVSARAAGVRPGSVIALHQPTAPLNSGRDGVAELSVVNGPGAGRVHRLALGETAVGCGAPGLSLPDLRLPADALVVEARPDGMVHVTPAPGLAVTCDGVPISDTVPWPAGTYVVAGDTVLALGPVSSADAHVSQGRDHPGLDFNRPPRLLPPQRVRRFALPTDPGDAPRRALPWLVVVAPAVMVVPLYVMFGPRAIVFAVMSPVLAMANFLTDKRSGRQAHQRRVEQYRSDTELVEARVEQALTDERDERRQELLDPATALLTALGPGRRLWERRRTDDDHLVLRIGLADLSAHTGVDPGRAAGGATPSVQDAPPPRTVKDVPVGVDLGKLGVLGVAGDPEVADSVARWLVTQLAVVQSPRDVRVILLTHAASEDRWGWVSWLPHLHVDGAPVVATVGTDQDSVGRRLAELAALVADRTAVRPSTASTGTWTSPAPDVVVVLDGVRRLRALPGVVALLRDGPAVGIRLVCLDTEVRLLPEECQGVVVCGPEGLTLRRANANDIEGIRPDLVELVWAERVARALAPLRDATSQEESGALPPSARLLELLDLDPPTAEGVLAAWLPGRTTDVVLGAGYDGVFRLDLRRDGPHVLIAGTTGSGKSELLQTLVASLAAANRADELTFVLVDYKGGSAFKDCARLPHTVGMVTDLDNHLVSRALTSLGAELRRREHLLVAPGAKDLEDYWALQAKDPSLPAVARLVIVIDEFASMVAELPDFVRGLVSIAQRGRSLGIHLVLATQRPTGVVSPEIRANTNLRVSLRVTDDAESRDVIDSPEAGRIPRGLPGRGYARTGHSSLLPFQAGRVGGRRPGPRTTAAVEPLAWTIPWSQVGAPAPQRPAVGGSVTDEGDTDLSDLVQAIREAHGRSGVDDQQSPWLPPLPDLVTVAQLPSGGDVPAGVEPAPAGWALEDRPDAQAQVARTFGLGRDGHLYVIGGPRSGRSTALRTIVGALARDVATRDLHVYGLDCGNGALLALDALPHTGAVVMRTQTERADRLLRRLTQEVGRRQELLAGGGFADIAEQRAAVDPHLRLPYLLLVLDRWEGFTSSLGEIDGGRLTEDVLQLLREGASAGLHLLLSGDRSLASGRLATLVEHKLALRLPDRSDYTLLGISTKHVPDAMTDGRALWGESGGELQVAVLDGDTTGAGQAAALREIAAHTGARDASTPAAQRPFRLGALASEVPFAEVQEQMQALVAASPLWVPMGVGGDDLTPLGIDLSAAPVAMVAGPPRSGRTSLLRLIATLARAEGTSVLGICPRPSALTSDLGDDVIVGNEVVLDVLVTALRSLPAGSLVLVDDAEILREGALTPGMQALVRQAREKRWGVVVAGQSSELNSGLSGWLVDARHSRQGLLLSPQSLMDGDVVATRLTRSMLAAKVVPGRGLLCRSGEEPVMVQVPLLPSTTVPTTEPIG